MHPYLCIHEREIDERLIHAGNTAQHMGAEFGRRGLQWTHQTILHFIQKTNIYLSHNHPNTHKWIHEHTQQPVTRSIIRSGLGLQEEVIEAKEAETEHPIKATGQAGKLKALFKSALNLSSKRADTDEMSDIPKGTSFEELSMDSITYTGIMQPSQISSTKGVVHEQIARLEDMISKMTHMKADSSIPTAPQIENILQDANGLLVKLKEEQAGIAVGDESLTGEKMGTGFNLFGQIRNRRMPSK